MADLGNVTKITLPNGDIVHLKDSNAMPISGGTFTGPVTFGDSMTAPDANVGDLVVTGSASFTNNAQFNTINGVSVGNSPKFTDTTYTFANGTNGFTVTPSGGTAQTVTVTPSITNNVTGSGTSGKVVKFTGANTIGDGWGVTDNTTATAVTSSDTNLITGRTLYNAGYVKGVTVQTTSPIEGGSSSAGTSWTITHANSGATAGSYGDSAAQTPGYGSTFKVPYITVDAKGHVTGISDHTVKIPASDNTNTTYTLTNALASHKFTWTLTAGGSGSGSTTTTAELVAGSNITLTDDTTNKKITIAGTANNAVNQSASTTDSWRKILLHYTADSSSTTAVSNVTNVVYGAVGVSVQPSTGTVRATKYRVADNVELQYNSTTKALDFVFL